MGRAVALPPQYDAILDRSRAIGFGMNSDVLTGSLLRTLVSAKPGGAFLELGTGCGLGTSWIVDGMDSRATLVSVDNDDRAQAIARDTFRAEPRVQFILEDGATFLAAAERTFDLVYADTWPGKFSDLERALALVTPGGIYLVDDMLPQPNWPDGHAPKAAALIDRLLALDGFRSTWLDWSTGLIICVKTAGP